MQFGITFLSERENTYLKLLKARERQRKYQYKRYHSDPEYRNRQRELCRNYYYRDPERRKQHREYNRAYYRMHPDVWKKQSESGEEK